MYPILHKRKKSIFFEKSWFIISPIEEKWELLFHYNQFYDK